MSLELIDQRGFWNREFGQSIENRFERLHSLDPSSTVTDFIPNFILRNGRDPRDLKFLEICCGTGRNVNYLITLSPKKLTGIDFSGQAVTIARQRLNGSLNAFLILGDVTVPETYTGLGKYDVIIDCYGSVDIPNPGRKVMLDVTRRILRRGGYYLFLGVRSDKLINDYPGPETNSVYIPSWGKFEKHYSWEELTEEHKPLKKVWAEEKDSEMEVDGKKYELTLITAVFQKPPAPRRPKFK